MRAEHGDVEETRQFPVCIAWWGAKPPPNPSSHGAEQKSAAGRTPATGCTGTQFRTSADECRILHDFNTSMSEVWWLSRRTHCVSSARLGA